LVRKIEDPRVHEEVAFEAGVFLLRKATAAAPGGIQMVGNVPHFWGLPIVVSNLFPTSTKPLRA
jgi:hypothetical protein